ncbi:uncharacterized protein SRS1_10065 [Sporisorium reilianum f. sp. reilianum]|uniref:Uncharacterized protein n=1 Tax=Sporisorium reilianum f. sp. reilianum TaxID=72559 RepID=A0A2N8ULD7_9BASI|nr:uncharacterized protein SRS1_10065 [Sporisorium reilianum f. sp. reilianum]
MTTQPDLSLHYQSVVLDIPKQVRPTKLAARTSYVYLFLPVSQQRLAIIVPELPSGIDWSLTTPVLVHRLPALLPNRFGLTKGSHGGLEFVGVEMIRHPSYPVRDDGIIPRTPLRKIISLIKEGHLWAHHNWDFR